MRAAKPWLIKSAKCTRVRASLDALKVRLAKPAGVGFSHGFTVRSFCIKYFASPAAGYPNLPLQLMAQKARVMRVYEGRRRCIAMSLAR